MYIIRTLKHFARLWTSLIFADQEFHNVAAMQEKDLCTHSKVKRGKANLVPMPRRLYSTVLSLKISLIYDGPKLFNAF